ncbi:MAG: DNA replication protein [Rhodospirillales bacterium]|nr:DNA replication protein [Rhodospirillales bacterium]
MVPRQLPLALEHPPSLVGENFLVAPSNRDAVRWLERWPDWPSPAIALFGPSGCGKTHLCQVFLTRSLGVSVEPASLMYDRAIDLIAHAPACVIDDADGAIAAGLEEPLLHLYNSLAEHKGKLLLTARAAPARWPVKLADLRSRLNAVPSIGIGAPDDDLIAGVLVKLFADRHLIVDSEVVLYALPRIERSFAAAQRLVADLDAAALGSHRKITVALLRDVIRVSGCE